MIYDDLDQFLNKDSITSGVKINSSNVDSIIESWAIPTTSIEWLDETTAWQEAQINQALQDAAEAIADAATAQWTADGKVTTFYADNAPTAEWVGDLWIDTNDGNKLYRWSGSSWIEVQDDAIATAISAAWTAQATADGKIVSFFQTSAPTAWAIWDLWIDTDDNNHLYRWSGSAWVSAKDTSPIVQTLDTRWFTNWLTFSSTWYSNITWTSGTLTFADWSTYSISSGSNTNTTTSTIYIYLDISVSTTSLQTTTTASSAVWDNKCLVCVKKTNSDSSKKAIFQVMWWADSWVFITADNIAANTITANEIATNTITTNQLSATAIDGMTITWALLRTSPYANTGIKISEALWWIAAYWESLNLYDTSWNIRWYIWANSSDVYMIWVASKNIRLGSYQDIILDAASSFSVAPARANVDCWNSSYPWRTLYTNIIQLIPSSTNPSTGQIRNYVSWAIDQFRWVPWDWTWAWAFDMTAY